MKEFLKAQATAIIATMVDYTVSLILKEYFSVWYLAASIIGTTSGGITNFILGRNWAFKSKGEVIQNQAFKFLIVWIGNLLLNAGGMVLITERIGHKYWWISKIVVSVLVGIGYNYVLQKFFVFKKGNGQLAKA